MTALVASECSLPFDATTFSTGVELDDDAVWVTRGESDISHPEEYQDWYRQVEDQSYWFRHRAECIVTCMRRLTPPQPLFDVGGGNGHVSLAMQNAGFEPVLLEPSGGAVANARRRGLKRIINSTLQEAELKPGCVGAIGLFDVLEHIDEERDFLRQLREVMQSGGRLYVTVPAFQALWSWHDTAVGHFRRYTLKILSQRLGEAGFETELASYLFAPLVLPIFLLRSIPTRLRLVKESSPEHFQREHAVSGGLASRTLEALLAREKRRLERGKTIPFGSTCLAVARAV